MHKYEIMLMLSPKAEANIAPEFMASVFNSKNISKSEKLDLTDLAYPINKSTQAQYFVFEVSASAEEIKEFNRLANINKAIWRNLVINLDTERGYGKTRKMSPQRKHRLAKFQAKPGEKPAREFTPRKKVVEKAAN